MWKQKLTVLHYRAGPVQSNAILPRQRIRTPLCAIPAIVALRKIVNQERNAALLPEHVVLLRLHVGRHDDGLFLGQVREPHERQVGRPGSDVDGAEVGQAAAG